MKKIALIIAASIVSACSHNPASNLSTVAPLAGAAGLSGVGQSINAGPLVQKMNESLLNMSLAQKHTFDAFGLKKEAELAASNAKAYENGNALNAEIHQQTEANNKMIDDFTAKNKKLNAEGKKKLAEAMPYYNKSMLSSAGLGLQMSQAVSSISANPMSLASGPYKANELITVLTASPKLLTQMATTTKHLTTYASTNGVDTKEVDASLKNLK